MPKIKQESAEVGLEIKEEVESGEINDVSCEIVDIQPAKIPKLENRENEDPVQENKPFNEQQTVVIDDEVSDDEDCILVTFKCDLCPKSFYAERHLKKHKNRHNWVVCRTCNKKLSTEIKLQQHKQDLHDNPGRFQCTLCGKKFNTQKALNHHIKKKNRPAKIYRCQFCTFTCGSYRPFKNHKKIHKGFMVAPIKEPKTELMIVKEEPKIELMDVKEEPTIELIMMKEEPKIELMDVKEEP
jgi:hypothetical protein